MIYQNGIKNCATITSIFKGERKKCTGDKATLLRLAKLFEQYPIVKKYMVSPTFQALEEQRKIFDNISYI